MSWLQTKRATLWHGNALDVYEQLSPASFELVISDGPYGIGKDRQWDPGSVDALPELYEPHVAAWGRLCKPAASVYLWGTAASWAAVHPAVLAHGWRFRALVTWDKTNTPVLSSDYDALRTWPDATEVAGFYQREPDETDLWNTYGERHPARLAMRQALDASGLTLQQVDQRLGVSDMARHWFTWSQWCLPSEHRWEQLSRLMPVPALAELREMHDQVWSAYVRQRDAQRAPFTLPHGVTNVWRHPLVSGGERLRAADGSTLHPCQKPLSFYRRMIRASTRPGAQVLEPFGGTCRAAVAAQQVGDRHAVCVEMNEVYLRAVRPALQFVPPAGGLFE